MRVYVNHGGGNKRPANKAVAGGVLGLVILCIAAPIVLTGVIGVGVFSMVRKSLAGMDQRHKVGPVVFTKDGNLVTVVENEQTTSYSQRGSFTTRSVHSTYFLQANRISDGNKVAEASLGAGRGMVGYSAKLLGYTPPVVWVLTDQLKAFDAATLKEVASETTLGEKNSRLAGKFVHDSNYAQFYRVDPNGKSLLVTTNDGFTYAIDPKTMTATETENQSDGIQNGLRLAADLSKANRHVSEMTTGGVRHDNEFLWIAVRPELKNGIYAYTRFGESARRSLWAAPLRKERYTEKVGEVAARNAKQTYLGGGFLTAITDRERVMTALQNSGSMEDFAAQNRAGREAIRLSNPNSYLVLHVDRIDDEGRLLLSRIKPDGSVLWTAATAVKHKKLADIRVTDTHVLFFGQNAQESSDEASQMVGIRLSDGKTYVYDYKENRLAQP
jgi:outer membrane protein assembly factor BamB